MPADWGVFILCAAGILYGGTKLSKYGDMLAEKTGLSATWIGVAMLASVTSLPELATGISSVTIANSPDIAVGDVLGSCVFNLVILAVMDALHRRTPISAYAHRGHILAAAFGALLITMAAVGLLAGSSAGAIGWVGIPTIVIALTYLVGMRTLFTHERRLAMAMAATSKMDLKYAETSLRSALIGYGVNALIVIGAALVLPSVAHRIALASGLSDSFMGVIFVAIATSLPEVVISLAALRLGAFDLAIGNLFGSNMINAFVLTVDDFFYTQGPLLTAVSNNHVVPAMAAIAMTAVSIAGLTYRAEKKRLPIATDSVAIIGIYLLTVWTLSRLG